MEGEKPKKLDFFKLPIEPFDKLDDYFKEILSNLDNYENFVQLHKNPFF